MAQQWFFLPRCPGLDYLLVLTHNQTLRFVCNFCKFVVLNGNRVLKQGIYSDLCTPYEFNKNVTFTREIELTATEERLVWTETGTRFFPQYFTPTHDLTQLDQNEGTITGNFSRFSYNNCWLINLLLWPLIRGICIDSYIQEYRGDQWFGTGIVIKAERLTDPILAVNIDYYSSIGHQIQDTFQWHRKKFFVMKLLNL